jgi:hypothetical protein
MYVCIHICLRRVMDIAEHKLKVFFFFNIHRES